MSASKANATSHHRLIQDATGAAEADIVLIERIMRDEVFHSTLDWQSRAQLVAGARTASRMLDVDRAFFEEDQTRRAALVLQMQALHKDA